MNATTSATMCRPSMRPRLKTVASTAGRTPTSALTSTRAFPNATVYVHEKGARHLVDPSRLVDSAALVYGDLLDSLYGRLDPTPSERIHVLEDGETISVDANRTLTTVDSPGHAKHHLALHDSESGLLFAGDAVGVRLPDAGVLRPATPPPDFDLEQAITSLRKFAERGGTCLGPSNTANFCDGCERRVGKAPFNKAAIHFSAGKARDCRSPIRTAAIWIGR